MRGMQFSFGPVCILLQLSLMDVTREPLWLSACECTHVSGWLISTGVNTVAGAALATFLSALKHNQ